MYARVARWEGAEPEALRRTAKEMQDRVAGGPPEGVPAKGFTMLFDADSGTSYAIALFATEEDMATGDRALNDMQPTGGDDAGRRVSVEMFEVAVDVRI